MSRSLVFALVAVMLLGASVASASDWYCGVGFGGMSNYWLHPYWYGAVDYDGYYAAEPFWYMDHTEYGIFDYRQVFIGLDKEVWDFELGIGWSGFNWSEEDNYEVDRADYEYTEGASWYDFNLAALYKVMEPDPIELDVGLRFQLHNAKWEWDTKYFGEEAIPTGSEKISGWSMGPLVRARWYFGDGALAIGPEVYTKYTSLNYEYERLLSGGTRAEYDTFEASLSGFNFEYSMRLEFFF
ncbi:MAG: hypothetical protein ABIG03_04225 [Candidatus Eisenbacteria bacterium]